MIIITYGIVTSGFDWFYFNISQNEALHTFLFPAVAIGGIVPLFIPLLLLFIGVMRKNTITTMTGWALAQAVILGSIISSVYKAFTGRIPPVFVSDIVDISREFQFGFMRGGIFWGWPSSHTTIAFAMATTLIILYPKKRNLLLFSVVYALYVGLGISISIHWFSEFVAGAILGSVIGAVVGSSFRPILNLLKK